MIIVSNSKPFRDICWLNVYNCITCRGKKVAHMKPFGFSWNPSIMAILAGAVFNVYIYIYIYTCMCEKEAVCGRQKSFTKEIWQSSVLHCTALFSLSSNGIVGIRERGYLAFNIGVTKSHIFLVIVINSKMFF